MGKINHGMGLILLIVIEIADNICQDINCLSQCLVLVLTGENFSTIRTKHSHLGMTKADTEMARISA